MNQALGNAGTTVTYGAAIEASPTDNAASLNDLVRAMDAGQVELLVMLGGVNPVYTRAGGSEVFRETRKGRSRPSITASTPTKPRTSATGTFRTRIRSRAGGMRARTTARSRLFSRSSRHFMKDGRRANCSACLYAAARSTRLRDRQGLLDESVRRRSGWTIRGTDGQPFKNADTFWRRALHDGFIAGTAIADGGPGRHRLSPLPRRRRHRRAAAGAAAGAPRHCSASNRAGATSEPHSDRGRRPGADLPARSDDVGRPLRQQRLAAGTAQAVDEGHVGHDGVDQPAARQGARPERRRRHRAEIPRQHRADAGLPRPRSPARSRSRCSSATAGAWLGASAPTRRRPNRSTRFSSARPTRPGSATASRSPRPASGICSRRRRNIT